MPIEGKLPQRALPNGKAISALGFGCSSLWAKPGFPEESAIEMLRFAVENGLNYFDTAPSYADGESRLGAFLAQTNTPNLVISTKVGTEHLTHRRSFDPARMRDSFESSLDRLGVPSVDILYLHGPGLSDLNQETFDFFEELKSQKKISYSGVNSFDPQVVSACLPSPIDAVMLQYSLSDRRFDQLVSQLFDAGKIVIAGTIMSQGIFEPKKFLPTNANSLWYLLRALKNDPLFLIKGRAIRRRVAGVGMSPHEASVRFAISNSAITSSLFGTTKLANMAANILAGAEPLSIEQCRSLVSTRGEGQPR